MFLAYFVYVCVHENIVNSISLRLILLPALFRSIAPSLWYKAIHLLLIVDSLLAEGLLFITVGTLRAADINSTSMQRSAGYTVLDETGNLLLHFERERVEQGLALQYNKSENQQQKKLVVVEFVVKHAQQMVEIGPRRIIQVRTKPRTQPELATI